MARSKKRVSHIKEAFFIICIVVFLLIGLFGFIGPGGYRDMKKAQVQLETHQTRVQELQKSSEERIQSIKALGDDRENNEAIERIARKKGYGKKGELVQEVPQPEPLRPPAKVK
jgi:cell division protein FtsB